MRIKPVEGHRVAVPVKQEPVEVAGYVYPVTVETAAYGSGEVLLAYRRRIFYRPAHVWVESCAGAGDGYSSGSRSTAKGGLGSLRGGGGESPRRGVGGTSLFFKTM